MTTPPHTTPPLFIHHRASAGVDAFRGFDLVGDHPLYLVGMELPEHRNGPAVAALLLFGDGRLIAIRSRRIQLKTSLTQIFESDLDGCDAETLGHYSKSWNDQLGGFTAVMPWTGSDHQVARALLADAALAPMLSEAIETDSQGRQPNSPPWDTSQVALMFLNGVVCAVTGFTPAINDACAATDDPELRRELLLTTNQADVALLASVKRSRHDRVSKLLAEATNVVTVSPRATVGLLRTAAELLVAEILAEYEVDCSVNTLHARIGAIEQAWASTPHQPSSQDRLETAWKAKVVACLDSIREHGNAIHHDHSPTHDDAVRSLTITRQLLSALGRVEVLDQPGQPLIEPTPN